MDAKRLAVLRAEESKLYVEIPKLQRESRNAITTNPAILAKVQRRQEIQKLFSEHFDMVLSNFDTARADVTAAKESKQDVLLTLDGATLLSRRLRLPR